MAIFLVKPYYISDLVKKNTIFNIMYAYILIRLQHTYIYKYTIYKCIFFIFSTLYVVFYHAKIKYFWVI